MIKKAILSIFFIVVLLFTTSAVKPSEMAATGSLQVGSASIADIIAKYEKEIPQHMQQDNIPGLAIAVVDDQGILWQQAFGYTDWDQQMPITPSTIFSIQSMSKSFTATAAMFAAQDGLVDLDAPITTYLPDFHVNSIFEDHPEQKMTLRILLSHTAGFPHDPVYGGNNDYSPFSFEKHIASISETWLMFPVGTRYSYSNIGIDLAGYILQVVSGMPFTQYVQEKVLDPLGMMDSTLDYLKVRATATRAIGHNESPLRPPIDFMLIPSGGVWTSTEDMARYLQFHINEGALNGTRLLRQDLAETMYTPPNLPANHYALGIVVDTRNASRHFQHGGGGFGFNSSMVWYPDLKLGSVVLTNMPQEDSYCVTLSEGMLDSIIASQANLYADRVMSAVKVEPAYPPSRTVIPLADNTLRMMITSKALPEDTAALQRRSQAAGTYVISSWGFPGESIEVNDRNGELFYHYQGTSMEFSNAGSLTEVEPGLFFTETGLTFDVRGPTPLVSEIPLVKTAPQTLPFRIILYALCGILFLSTLVFWPARLLVRRLRQKSTAVSGPTTKDHEGSWPVWNGILAGLASISSLFCLGLIALVPNLVYFPWPRPYVDLAWWQYALLSLPFASLVVAIAVGGLSTLVIRNRLTRWYYFTVALALLIFNAVILI